jgi:hypothetical protein
VKKKKITSKKIRFYLMAQFDIIIIFPLFWALILVLADILVPTTMKNAAKCDT